MKSYSIRIVDLDYYMSTPIQGLDVTYSEFRGSSVNKVPILRLFGSTATGKKICVHIHGVFPYIYLPFDGTQEVNSLMYQIATNIDKALNIALHQSSSNTQHVYKICLVSGVPMYGYHSKKHQFFKIYLYNPMFIRKISLILMNEMTLGKFYQPHEAHLNFTLQFMIDYNLHGMSNLILSEMKFRRNPSNMDAEVETELFLPTTISKMSVCEQEGDALAEHIVNREEVASGNIAVNPGIAALWADEIQRRRIKGDISQIPHFLELQNTNIPPTKSHYMYKTALLDRLAIMSTDINVSEKLNLSVYPAETPEGVNLQNASLVETPSSLELSLNDTALTSTDTLDESVTQTNILNQTLDAEAQDLLEILENLGENIEGDLEEDSILSQRVKEDEDDKDIDLSMPLEAVATPKKIIINKEDDASDEEELWNEFNTTFIPQLDGECDNEEEISIGDNLPNQLQGANTVKNFKHLKKVVQCTTKKVNNKCKVPKKTLYIKLINTDHIKQGDIMSDFKGRSMPLLDINLDCTVQNFVGVNNNVKTAYIPNKKGDVKYNIQKTEKDKIDCQDKISDIAKSEITGKHFLKPSKDSKFKMDIPKRKYIRKSPYVKTLEAIRSLGYQIRKDKRKNRIFRIARSLHKKERALSVLLSKNFKPKFNVSSKVKIHSQYIQKTKYQKFTENAIINDIILGTRKHIDPDLYLTVEYPSGECLLYNYNKSIYPDIFDIPKHYTETGNEKLLKSYVDEIKINNNTSSEDIANYIEGLTIAEDSFSTNYDSSIDKNVQFDVEKEIFSSVFFENLPDFLQKSICDISGSLEDILIMDNNNYLMDANHETLSNTRVSSVRARSIYDEFLSKHKNLKEFIDGDNKENFYIFSSKYLTDINDNPLIDQIMKQSYGQLRESVERVTKQLQLHIKYVNKPIYQNSNCNTEMYNEILDIKECLQENLNVNEEIPENNFEVLKNTLDKLEINLTSSDKCSKFNNYLNNKISIQKTENSVGQNVIENCILKNRTCLRHKNANGVFGCDRKITRNEFVSRETDGYDIKNYYFKNSDEMHTTKNTLYGNEMNKKLEYNNCLLKAKKLPSDETKTVPRSNLLPYKQLNGTFSNTALEGNICASKNLLLHSNIVITSEVKQTKKSPISNLPLEGDICSSKNKPLLRSDIVKKVKGNRRKESPISNCSSKNKLVLDSKIKEKVTLRKKSPISNTLVETDICSSKNKSVLHSDSVLMEKVNRRKKSPISNLSVERDICASKNKPVLCSDFLIKEKLNRRKMSPNSNLSVERGICSSKNKPLLRSNVIKENINKGKMSPISNSAVEGDIIYSSKNKPLPSSNVLIQEKINQSKKSSISNSSVEENIYSPKNKCLLNSDIMIKQKVNQIKKTPILNLPVEKDIRSSKNKELLKSTILKIESINSLIEKDICSSKNKSVLYSDRVVMEKINRRKQLSVSNLSVGGDICSSKNKQLLPSNTEIKEKKNRRKKLPISNLRVDLSVPTTNLRRSPRNSVRKTYIFLDGTQDSSSSSEDDFNTNRKKRKRLLKSQPYSALPISIVNSPGSSSSLNKSSADKHLVSLNTNKNSKKEKTPITQLVQQADCDINVKRRLNFGDYSSLQTTVIEEELACIYSPSNKNKNSNNNKNSSKVDVDIEIDSSHHINDSDNRSWKRDNREKCPSVSDFRQSHFKNENKLVAVSDVYINEINVPENCDISSSESENEINTSFFNSPQIVKELNSVATVAEKYDKETNYIAIEGTSKVFTPQSKEMPFTDNQKSSEEIQHSSGSSSFGLLTPYQRIERDINLSTVIEDEVKIIHVPSSGSSHLFSSGTSENKLYLLPNQESIVKTKIDDILNAKHITVCLNKKAPSKEDVLKSLDSYKISHVKEDIPFYSNVDDVTGIVEVGYNVLKISSKTTIHLPEFESQFDGINNFRKLLLESNYPNLQWKKSHINKFKLNFCIDRNCIIKPIKEPPTVSMVKTWIKEKSRKTVTPEKKIEKMKVIIPCSPGNDSDLEMSSLTISPCTPTISKFNAPNVVQQTPKSVKTPLDLDVETITKKKSQILTQSDTPSLRKSLLLSLDSSHENQSSQITGVTMNNTYGFDNKVENLQDARAVIEYQHLTLLIMELHISTCGDYKPNPSSDPIHAIFYSVSNDVAENNPRASKCKGMIAVNNLPVISTNSKVPILNGVGVDCDIIYVDSEENLFNEFLNLIHYWDPDILAGYEIEMLSWGYLLERSYILGINLKDLLGRTREKAMRGKDEERQNELKIVGRIILDVWRLMRHEIALQSYTFESIIYHILHKRVPQYSFKDLTFWWNHRSSLYRHRTVQYYLFRVESILELFDKLDIIARTSELARLFGILFYEVLSRGSQFRVESMMLRLAKPLNFIPVSPDKQQRAKMKAPEYIPLVLEPESKLYNDPVIVLDFQSLYPSIIIAYNYCFTTCVGRVENLGKNIPFEFGVSQLKVSRKCLEKLLKKDLLNFSPCGVGFVKKKVRDGILPRMLREILDTRLMVKNSMKENGADEILQKVLHNRQLGLKLIANVTYGYTAANFSGRMPSVEVGDSVVSKGRETLQRAIEMVDTTAEWGARVVYGDTDSLFVLVPGRSREHAFEVGKKIADAVTRANPDPIKLKMEKVYQPCILQTKKRYVGYMYESADQKEPVYDAKGIETVRRDTCPAVSKILEKCLRLLFETKDVSMIKKYVLRQFNKILAGRASIQDLTFAKEYRGADGYRPGACVPSLELARKWTAIDKRNEPRSGERVPYIIVNGPPGLPLIRLVQSPRDLLNDPSLRPNALYYITRVIIPPINRCLKLIGCDVQTWFNQMPRRQTQYLPNSVSPTKKSTISQYFSTISCVACGDQTQSGICDKCTNEPQVTTITLMEKVKDWEENYYNCNLICQSCTSSQIEIKCISLDCPVLYRRLQTNRDVQQASYVRQLLCSSEFLF